MSREMPPSVGDQRFQEALRSAYDLLCSRLPTHINWSYKVSHGLMVKFRFSGGDIELCVLDPDSGEKTYCIIRGSYNDLTWKYYDHLEDLINPLWILLGLDVNQSKN